MLCNLNWHQKLNIVLSHSDRPRVVIAGVGQVLCGDDGAGPAVIAHLRTMIPFDDRLLLLDCGHAPENCLGSITRFRPDQLVFLDAVRADGEPGDIYFLDAGQALEMGGSTHTLSLGVLAEYIHHELPSCVISIIGIQPLKTAWGDGISGPAEEAITIVARKLADYWRNALADSSAMVAGDLSVVNT